MSTRKRLETRLSAWWSAWKYVAILGLCLSVSLYANYRQLIAKHRAADKAEIAGLKDAQDVAAGLISDGQKRERALLNQADAVAKRLSGATRDYDEAVSQRPLPQNCAPGEGRVNAVNRALGAAPGEVK